MLYSGGYLGLSKCAVLGIGYVLSPPADELASSMIPDYSLSLRVQPLGSGLRRSPTSHSFTS
jgi:hypothetical protein